MAASISTPGPEIGVASTKAFTAQVSSWSCSRFSWGASACCPRQRGAQMLRALEAMPAQVESILARETTRSVGSRSSTPSPRTSSSRPAVQFPGGSGRRAQAEGDLLHPRRGLSGRRDEARPDRHDRRTHADGVRRPNDAFTRRPWRTSQEIKARKGRSSPSPPRGTSRARGEGGRRLWMMPATLEPWSRCWRS
jgi:hypothetical protein